jgi:hypothetical protein
MERRPAANILCTWCSSLKFAFRFSKRYPHLSGTCKQAMISLPRVAIHRGSIYGIFYGLGYAASRRCSFFYPLKLPCLKVWLCGIAISGSPKAHAPKNRLRHSCSRQSPFVSYMIVFPMSAVEGQAVCVCVHVCVCVCVCVCADTIHHHRCGRDHPPETSSKRRIFSKSGAHCML